MNGAQLILDYLESCNIKYIFGCPGTTEVALLDALVDRTALEYILVPQEGVAVSVAEGWARVTGQLGVVNLHASVGLANGVSQINAAQMGQAPLLILNCLKPRQILSRGAFTCAHDHQELVKQFTKWDWVSFRPKDLMGDLRRAVQMALTLPAGSTYLGIPQDLLEAEVIEQQPVPVKITKHAPIKSEIVKAAELLSSSKFPLILVGSGVAIEGAMAEAIEMADCLGAAVVSENRLHMDYNSFPTDHPNYLGPFKPNSPLLKQADAIFVVGTRLFVEFQPAVDPWLPPDLPIIHLYPEGSEIGRLYPVEIGLSGSVLEGLTDLNELLKKLVNEAEARGRYKQVKQLHDEYKANREEQLVKVRNKIPLKVPYLVECISKVMDELTTVVVDAATSNDPFVEFLDRYNERSLYTSSTGGSLGWGLGAALGVKLGAPERKVLSVAGDGVFMFGNTALWTAAKYQIPVVFVVINNSSYAAVKAGLLRYNQQAAKKGVFPATDISGPNYAEVAKGFGVDAERISDPNKLQDALERALQLNKPYLLEIMTDPMDVGNIAR